MTELERSLYLVGAELDVPATPDLAAAVRSWLQPRGRRPWERRRFVVAVAVAALALLGATLAIPDARSAFLRIFDIGGTRFELVDDLPEVEAVVGLEQLLGSPVTLEEARRTAGFDLRELEEEPDRVYVEGQGGVWFLYGTPENVRLLVSQTPRLMVDGPGLVKKLSGLGTRVEMVPVGERPGVFLSGEPHFMYLLDEQGRTVESSPRLAADVLVWDDGGVAYRLEGDFELEDALELAGELR